MMNFRGLVVGILSAGALFAQGRGGGGDWRTAGFDAQRTSWKRTDARLTPEAVKTKFQLLWQFRVPNEARQLNSLTEPVMLDGLHSYTGMRTTLVMGTSSGAAYSIDADLGRLEWMHSFGAPAPHSAGSLACPGGVTSSFTRSVTLQPQAAGGRGGGGRARRAEGAVGQPDQGAPNLAQALAGGGGRGRGGRGGASAGGPEGFGGEEGAAGGGRGRGGVSLGTTDAFYSVAGDGMVHALNVQDGSDLAAPVRFLPPDANVSGLMLIDRVLYAATSNECGGAANGVWALDLASPDKTVTTWKSNGGGSVGTMGAAAGAEGTLYIATSDSLVSLAPKTLAVKGQFAPDKTAFDSSPVVFPLNGKDWIVAAGKDGRLFLVDSMAPMGAAYTTAGLTASTTDFSAGALATWQDASNTRWVLLPVAGPLASGVSFPVMNGPVKSGTVAAFKVVSDGGTTTLQPAWMSRDMASPATPIVVNGIVFALGTGEYHTADAKTTVRRRAQRSVPAVLYALDAATGKEVWNSGKSIASFVHSGGLSSGNSQVYVSTWDSVLYAFGIPMER